jgi:MSHA pilin protein MshC
MASEKGFTLIELVMTLVLLGILSATAMPKFFSVSSYHKQLFFDDTLAAVRYAQKLAVATGCNVQVSIATDTYTVNRPEAPPRAACTSQISTDFTMAVRHPGTGTPYSKSQAGVSLTADPTTPFYFTAVGEASTDVTITVAGNKFLCVVAGTGFVYDPDPELVCL